jgi:hypothetical protein
MVVIAGYNSLKSAATSIGGNTNVRYILIRLACIMNTEYIDRWITDETAATDAMCMLSCVVSFIGL